MSRGLNRTFLLGYLGRRPEIRTTASGLRVATFSIATDRGSRGARAGSEGSGRGQEAQTDWHRIVAWDRLAELAARTLEKGDRVFVEGRVEYRSYKDAAGRDRQVTEIVAEDLIAFDSRAPG